jgi:hypothetical protein
VAARPFQLLGSNLAALPGGKSVMMGAAGGVIGGVSGYMGSDAMDPNQRFEAAWKGAMGGALLGAGLGAVSGIAKLAGGGMADRFAGSKAGRFGRAFLGRREGSEGMFNWALQKTKLKMGVEAKVGSIQRKLGQGVDLVSANLPGGVAHTKRASSAAYKQSKFLEKEANAAFGLGDMAKYEDLATQATTAANQGKRLENQFLQTKGTEAGAAAWKASKKYGNVANYLDRELPTRGVGGFASSFVRAGIKQPAQLAFFGAVGFAGVAAAGAIDTRPNRPRASIAYTPENMMLNETAGMVSPSPGTGLSTGYGFNNFAQSTDNLVFGLHQGRHS